LPPGCEARWTFITPAAGEVLAETSRIGWSVGVITLAVKSLGHPTGAISQRPGMDFLF